MIKVMNDKWLFLYLFTCRQSNAVFTILGHFDWQASSNGKKYLSASTKPALAFGSGRAAEELLSMLIK